MQKGLQNYGYLANRLVGKALDTMIIES